VGCGGEIEASIDNIPSGGADGGSSEEASIGETVFDTTALHEVQLEFSSSDWQDMVAEAETTGAYDGPRTYFRADFRFDGQSTAGKVGVRLKGHASLIGAQGHSFPLKVDFNRFTVKQRFDGLGKVNLHPSDPMGSGIREHLSYGAMRRFGVPTARTSFARLRVNGEDLGLYVLVEQLDGRFVRYHYDEPYGDLYKPEPPAGTLAYRGSSIDDYENVGHKWPEKADHTAFLKLVTVLDTKGVESFSQVVDVDDVLAYLAVNAGVGNFDLYSSQGHNYYLYEKSKGVFTMLPWDMNASMESRGSACAEGRGTAEFPLSHKLLGDVTTVEKYADTLTAFLAGPGSVASLKAAFDKAAKLLSEKYPDIEPHGFNEVNEQRIAEIMDELENLTQCPE